MPQGTSGSTSRMDASFVCINPTSSHLPLQEMSKLLHIYRCPGASESTVLRKAQSKVPVIVEIKTEFCFNVDVVRCMSQEERQKLLWLFTETFEPENVRENKPFLEKGSDCSRHEYIFEVGPRLAFTTAWSSNCSSMCEACGITSVGRIERSRRYKVVSSRALTEKEQSDFVGSVHDRMTECLYKKSLDSFDNGVQAEAIKVIPLLEKGKIALEQLNKEKGLGFDDWDLDFYTNMFCQTLQRNPTEVECFDLAQSNSEHSRHWFFGGKMIIDGQEKAETLFQMVKSTLSEKSNSVIAFHDNSSAIYGFQVDALGPANPGYASNMETKSLLLHPILTAETHNFPSGVAPYPGAETGTGGRLRDVQATGRGAHTLAGVSSYCVGNLNIPHHPLPWEDKDAKYPSNLALPLEIEVEASNGASDYGNKYGEPVVAGFTRSFGQRLPDGERIEWIKPIMFTAGVGLLDGRHSVKGAPEVGMIICKIGGPAYRIGMGGGAASSRVQGTADASLDFDAVQRGDAEMENRMNRVLRACIEMGEKNPIVSIHDQGAGGNGNVLKEIVDPLGAIIELRSIPVGDPTLSVTEIWGAEYQENNAFLVRPDDLALVMQFSKRENCPVTAVGTVTGDGRVVVKDKKDNTTPFDLPLSLVLGKMPQKSFYFATPKRTLQPLSLPSSPTAVMEALHRVLKLLDVGSKRFLTNKVDRSVTGLIAQQQCCGPLHTPLSGVGVLALSHFTNKGMAVAVGEQPIKGLLSAGAQARMTVGEALANLVFAPITCLEDVKASGNWMWAAKLEGEGARMYEACEALRDCLVALGPGVDGGKDSLSMAAKVDGETVKSPGEVTLTVYAPVTDITQVVTPDLKYPEQGSRLLFIHLGGEKNHRLGGSALSTVYGQLGDSPADMVNAVMFKACFEAIQECIKARLLSAGQDRSDGGLITTLLEMAFAGNTGFEVLLPKVAGVTAMEMLFNEELGFVLQVLPFSLAQVQAIFAAKQVPVQDIGKVVPRSQGITLCYDEETILNKASMEDLRDIWESTSFALEKLQCDPVCVRQEEQSLRTRTGPQYKLTYDLAALLPSSTLLIERPLASKPIVAVIRQEGSNGDREMLAALHSAGCQAWDVNMQDLLTDSKRVNLDMFRGIVFCGGFSYADVNDSAKGWAGVIRFNPSLLTQFSHFRNRSDTFTLGICNGCQLMALLGLVPFPENEDGKLFTEALQPRFIHNASGRFESRWTAVKILPSKAVLLQGMEGSTLGVWVAHGEGKAYFPEPKHLTMIEEENLAPVRYVDDQNEITEAYPMNPNGSPHGIAGLCSRDGRHLAMMPHPERCFLSWQLPYNPLGYGTNTSVDQAHLSYAPWTKLFHNARIFCETVPKL